MSADLKIRLIFSTIGKLRGRGKIERFFKSLSQKFLSRLPGYQPGRTGGSAVLTLPELSQELERYLIGEYLVTPHQATKQAPQLRWEAGGFLPQMPESLEQLDLLLLTVPKRRRIHQDSIRFMGMRYIDPMLAAYVGEDVGCNPTGARKAWDGGEQESDEPSVGGLGKGGGQRGDEQGRLGC